MAVLNLKRRHQYGNQSKGHPPESLTRNSRETCLKIIPKEIYRVSTVANC
jgi:hypothetical protein